ncbi:MAG: DUF929 family protein [Candidatus Micrarchaeaceae archaeon]
MEDKKIESEIQQVDKDVNKIAKIDSKETSNLKNLKLMNYAIIGLVVVLIALLSYETINVNSLQSAFSSMNSKLLNMQSQLSNLRASSTIPSTTVPQITGNFGSTINNIDQPFNAIELNVINNMNNSYYEKAGEMLLNGTLTSKIFYAVNKSLIVPPYIIDGKPTVIYIGALSCLYCGENRWAMALALSRFGNFSALYKGYSSFGDYDLPTIYWTQYNYTTSAGVAFGANYSSKYINFIAADFESPVTGGFEIAPLSYFIAAAPNSTYAKALEFMNETKLYRGTPFDLFGRVILQGADAVVLGNTLPTAPPIPLEYMTHEQVIQQFADFNDQFAWGEYAAADVYVAYICNAINNTAPACKLPAILKIEQISGITQ